MTEQVKHPVRYYFYHFGGWLLLAILNATNRNLQDAETFDQSVASVFGITVICGLLALLFRLLINRLRLIEGSGLRQWLWLITAAASFGFISAVINVAWSHYYLVLAGYSSVFFWFWSPVFGNWLIMTILMLSWSVIYVAVVNTQRLRYVEQQQTQLNLQLKSAQLNALMGQLNPHFLFNGLNNIRSLMLENVDKSREMLTNLADLLRYSLMSHKQQTVALSEELEIVAQYIELAKIQYEARLDYQATIEPHVSNTPIPPLLIQLLVENAVRHGIDRSKQGGVLSVQVSKQDEYLQIQVSNPGQLQRKQSESLLTKANQSTGLGLDNIRHRLQLLYDGQASLTLQQQDDNVVATCRIPIVARFTAEAP